MGALKRATTALAMACVLTRAVSIFGQQSESVQPESVQVEVMGELQVYDTTGLICETARDSAVLVFAPTTDNLSFDGQTNRFDSRCGWLGSGQLYGQEAALELQAEFEDFIQTRPTAPIPIRNTGGQRIRVPGIRVILYSRARRSAELRALANLALAADDMGRAIRLFDESFASQRNPETLYQKADALDEAGRYVEAATTWNTALGVALSDPTIEWRRRDEIPWRWTDSLYRAAHLSGSSDRQRWLTVARATEGALSLEELPAPVNRPRILATWLDALFTATGSDGDYAELVSEVLRDDSVRLSWEALYYEGFRGESPPSASVGPTREELVQQVAELEQALGRKEP